MSVATLTAPAVADVRERTRRPAYLVTLAAAVGLGYLTLPPATSLLVIMDAGGYRGVYDSAYAGTVTALAGTMWLMFGGFYVVRGAIARDRETGVGQILAATRMSNAGYLAGKFLSNLMVLASMAGVLAVTALVLQLSRGESTAVDPVALLLPFVLITLPALAVTAAAAVLFETVRPLRAGLGNIVWFFVWMTAAIAGGGAPLGGMGPVSASMRADMTAQGLDAGEFSVGFTQVQHPLSTFTWGGLDVTGGFVGERLLLVLIALCMAALPALWFTRFDPARARGRALPDGTQPAAPLDEPVLRAPSLTYKPLSPVNVRATGAFWRLLGGEVRILAQGVSRWWWLVAAGINVVAVAVPSDVTTLALAAAWIWPVLIWSRLGTQRRENGMETLLGSYPRASRQVAAEWAAGIVLTALTGLGPVIGLAIDGNGPGVAAWTAGALFIPSLAFMLGTVSRTHRMFQAVYVAWWYAVVNGVAGVDFMGTVLDDNGHPAGPSPLLTAGLALAMLAITFLTRTARHASR